MYLLRRAASRALQLPSASLILPSRTFTTRIRAPRLLPTKQWATLPIQKRFATGEAESVATEQVTAVQVEEPSPTQEEASTEEGVAAEETSEVDPPPTTEASGSSTQPSVPPIESNTMQPNVLQTPAASETAPTLQDYPTSATANAASAITATAAAAAASSQPAQAETARHSPFPAIPPESNTIVYVGNLYFEVNEDALQQQFAKFGKINRVRIVYDHRGLSKGFGYVEFEKPEDAASAVTATNQLVFMGRRMAVQFHRRRPQQNLTASRMPNDPSKTLFIGNMSFEMSDKDLNDLFREVRNVVDVRVAIDRRTGQPRGFAHADFIDTESAAKAKQQLESKEIYGRRLRVDFSRSSAGAPPR